MRHTSSAGYIPFSPARSLAALLVGASLALAPLPGAPSVAASNWAGLDRQVLKAMQSGQAIHSIVIARGDLNSLQADLRRSGIKQTDRVPIAHGIAA
jgi:hypothetical protein